MPIEPGQAKAIFLAALEKYGPERATYLGSACGAEPALRQRVEAMLQAHEASGELLERLPGEMLADGGTEADATAPFCADPASPSTEGVRADPDEALAFLVTPSRAGSLGRLGHYHVQEVIGKGGFGIVLRAFDEKLHRIVAIKVLAPELAVSGTARERFIKEARSAAAVSHEHVVAIHGIDEEHRPPFIVMQCVDGVSLQQKINSKGPLDLKEILRIGSQTANGLAAAHKQGLVHRDIKPGNILLENGIERVKITDFGLARATDDASATQSGTVAGTPMYMSPEQANGESVDHRSDLFSLGTVLYVMCTGRPPFRATGTLAILKRVVEETPRPIREINPDIPDWLEAIVARLHAKKPEERFQTAQEVAELLGQHLADVQQPPVMAKLLAAPAPVAAESVPSRGRWRRPGWLVYCVSVMILNLIVAGAGLISGGPIVQIGAVLMILGASLTLIGVIYFRTSAPTAAPVAGRPASGKTSDPPLTPARRLSLSETVYAWIYGTVFFMMLTGLLMRLASTFGRQLWRHLYLDEPIVAFCTAGALGLLAIAGAGRRRKVFAVLALPLAVLAPVVAGIGVTNMRPGQAVLLVNASNPDVEVIIDGNGLGHALLLNQEQSVPAGTYRFDVRCGARHKIDSVSIVQSGGLKRTKPGGWNKDDLRLDLTRDQLVTMTVKTSPLAPEDPGWVQLFNGTDLTGWKTHPDQPGDWKVENGILVGRGPRSHLFSARGDYENFHLRVEARVNNLGNSGVYFRSEYGLGWGGKNPKGYEAQIFQGDAEDLQFGKGYGRSDQTQRLVHHGRHRDRQSHHHSSQWPNRS